MSRDFKNCLDKKKLYRRRSRQVSMTIAVPPRASRCTGPLTHDPWPLTGAISDKDAVKVGKLTGAKMIIAGSLYGNAEYYELFLKLLRVESGEVLSVTKARISKKLGL